MAGFFFSWRGQGGIKILHPYNFVVGETLLIHFVFVFYEKIMGIGLSIE
jgi:hypothetical protein